MRRVWWVWIVAFFSLQAADINTTLVRYDQNVSVYENYLAKLNQESKDKKGYKSLEKSLLYKLINITKFTKDPTYKKFDPKEINTSLAFVEGVETLLKERASYQRLKQEALATQTKRKSIKERIELARDGDKNIDVLQLQYAFYAKIEDAFSRHLKQRKQQITYNHKVLQSLFPKIRFERFLAAKQMRELIKTVQDIQLEIEDLMIEKERLVLQKKPKWIAAVSQKIGKLKAQREELIDRIVRLELIRFFGALQLREKRVFDIQKEIELWLKKKEEKETPLQQLPLYLTEWITAEMGTTKVLLNQTKLGIEGIKSRIAKKLHTPLFTINEKPINSIDIAVAILILIIGFTIAKLYRRYIYKITHSLINVTSSTQTIVSNIGYYLILLISFFVMLKSIGLDLSSLTLIAGALSVGIGFGLQNIVANFISGVILMFEKSIKIGDFIQINDELRGHVVDIQMRSTTIRTNDNIDIIVPNQTFIQSDVINWTLSDNQRRMRIPFGVAYGTDIKKVKTVILEALEASSLHFVRNDETKQPLVVMRGMGESSVDFELFVWVEGDETLKPLRTADKFLVLIYDTLYANDITIPFPQMDIHVKEELKIIKEDEKKGAGKNRKP
ncbi:MAG: hypothetical protein B6D59_07835 [Campylobacteraceae bacterium 4484_4]|nr:MAG: hypothetical protein B6D59_07835 [Campylobacteraceae bacterium 4484_4]